MGNVREIIWAMFKEKFPTIREIEINKLRCGYIAHLPTYLLNVSVCFSGVCHCVLIEQP